MKLVVGLGNPDMKYLMTRHNTGFFVVDSLLNKLGGLTLDDTKYNGCYIETKIEGEDVIIAKPMTYMNNSGEFVGPMCNFYKINSSDVIVCHDELALSVGRIKINKDGSAAGHNGIKNVITHLGTEKFNRVRVGIGPVKEHFDIVDFVLLKWDKDEFSAMKAMFDKASDAVIDIIKNGVDHAMNNYNQKI